MKFEEDKYKSFPLSSKKYLDKVYHEGEMDYSNAYGKDDSLIVDHKFSV